MEFATTTRITMIIVGGVVVLGLAALAVVSGSPVDAERIIEAVITGVAGLLAGIGVAGGKSERS